MTNTNLIIAIGFAGLFGLALMFIALWCLSRYIHRYCLDIGQWLHALSPQSLKDPPVVYVENHRSRSRKSERGRRLDSLRTKRDHESGNLEYEQTGGGSVDTRPTVQFCAPVQVQQQPYNPRYYPSLWQEQTQNMQRVMQHQTPMHWEAQGIPRVPAYITQTTVPQQPNPQVTIEISEPFQGPSRYQPHMLSQSQKGLSAKARSPEKYAREAREVDYIHICDEYPPFVLEALNKAALSSPPASSSSSSSSSSSDGSGTTQEHAEGIPRGGSHDSAWAETAKQNVPDSQVRGLRTIFIMLGSDAGDSRGSQVWIAQRTSRTVGMVGADRRRERDEKRAKESKRNPNEDTDDEKEMKQVVEGFSGFWNLQAEDEQFRAGTRTGPFVRWTGNPTLLSSAGFGGG